MRKITIEIDAAWDQKEIDDFAKKILLNIRDNWKDLVTIEIDNDKYDMKMFLPDTL